jgi:DNA invertase Pin-like site-specific DNA recombinase
LDFIRLGDELVVVKLDRLGRSTRDVLNLVHELEATLITLLLVAKKIYVKRAQVVLLILL